MFGNGIVVHKREIWVGGYGDEQPEESYLQLCEPAWQRVEGIWIAHIVDHQRTCNEQQRQQDEQATQMK